MPDLVQQAIAAKESGDMALARQYLSQAIVQNPRNETAWMMMSQIVDDIKQKRNCLERVLALNPGNIVASAALSKLSTSPLEPITRGERDKPITPPATEKIPPFTPPFTWNNEPSQYLALGDLTFPELANDQAGQPGEAPASFSWETEPEKPVEEPVTFNWQIEPEKPTNIPPTFDWARESDEPDEAIKKIFDAISNPEMVSQPTSETGETDEYLGHPYGETEIEPAEEQLIEDHWLTELVGQAIEPAEEQPPVNMDDFSVSAEYTLGLEAFTSPDIHIEAPAPQHILWDNPEAEEDRLIILASNALIYANPEPSDIPHIMGLFDEKKMLRDLLGETAVMIKLNSIERLLATPQAADLTVSYKNDGKLITHKLEFANPAKRDEALNELKLKLSPDFTRTSRSFSLKDKIASPLFVIVLAILLAWALVSGLPLLLGLSVFQAGLMHAIVAGLQDIITAFGEIYVILIAGLLCLLALGWLVYNLTKPANLIIIERPNR
jgi:hypothetical protein